MSQHDQYKRPTLVSTSIPGWLQPYKQDAGNYHTESTLEKALALLECGYSVAQICREHRDMPDEPHYLYKWFRRTPEIEKRYIEARRLGAEVIMDECIDIADGKQDDGNEILEDVHRSKLRIETRMRYAAKVDPERFGDKKTHEYNVNIDIAGAMERAAERVIEHNDAHTINHDPLVIEHGND